MLDADPVTGQPELAVGWRLARSSWGRGLATEAATSALDDLGPLRPHVLQAAERQTWRPHSVF